MSPSDVPDTLAEVPRDKGLSFRGLIGVFYEPTATFVKLKTSPKVLVPYLVLGLIWLAFFWYSNDLMWDMQVQSPQFQEQMQGQQMPANIEEISKKSMFAVGTLSMLLVPLLAALLGWFWGNFVFAGKSSFKSLLSVMLYGEVIYAVGALVVLPMMLYKGSFLVSLSLAVLAASSGPDSVAFVALSKIDLFLIWEIVAVGIGLSTIYGFERNRGYTLSVLSVGMLSILHVVFTAVGKLVF